MRVLKTALIALVTTCVLLPLVFAVRAAILTRRYTNFSYFVDPRTFLLEFLIVFGAMFTVTWFLLGRKASAR